MSTIIYKRGAKSLGGIIWLLVLLSLGGCMHVPLSDTWYEPTYPEYQMPPEPRPGAIYNDGFAASLYTDRRARTVGDIITVVLEEKTDADKDVESSANKATDVSITSPTLLGYTLPTSEQSKFTLDSSLSSDQTFNGSGSAKQSNSLSGTITVSVMDVLPNGYLMVKGQKLIQLNSGVEHIRIAGIIRPDDIQANNTVSSSQLADAKISYGGNGGISEAAQPGWLTRFFLDRKWPF